jgi:hypothetical protein
MNIVDRFLAYADAFEESLVDDDWSRVEAYFTEDAVYEGEPSAVGRAAVMAKFKDSVAGFDRRMDSRTPLFQPPTADGNALTMRWSVTYAKAGLPDLVISGVQNVVFSGDRIARLSDKLDPGRKEALDRWMAEHGEGLKALSDWES